MHMWGDEWFDKNGADLYAAIKEVEAGLRRARVSGYCKEKYGTLRIDGFYLWGGTIHGLIYPGYHYCQYKYKWMWKLDVRYISRIARKLGLISVLQRLQYRAVKKLIKRVSEKYPHIREEIMFEFEGWEKC